MFIQGQTSLPQGRWGVGEGNASFGSGYGGTSLSGGTPASVKEEVESFPLRSEAARVVMSMGLDVAIVTEELKVQFYSIVIHLNLNSHVWPVELYRGVLGRELQSSRSQRGQAGEKGER